MIFYKNSLFLFILSICITPHVSLAATTAKLKEITEEQRIAQSRGLASRTDKALSLTLLSKKKLAFYDSESCDVPADCVVYTYKGTLAKNQFFIVEAGYYEGGTIFIISRQTGAKYEIFDDPHLSPDGRYILASPASEATWGENGIYLWRIQNGGLVKEFGYEPSEYALYEFIKWINPHTALLEKTMHADKISCDGLAAIQVTFAKKNNVWELQDNVHSMRCL